MLKRPFFYVFRVQFLGFRYSGWQKQPNQKTIELMLYKTLKFILPENDFKILGAGRTDARVSALNAAFELFLDVPIVDFENFVDLFNTNLPADIRITGLSEVDENFNIIQNSKLKEYVYFFSFGEKNHPFAAPYITNILDDLDIGKMSSAASLFEGEHDFSSYTVRQKENKVAIRNISLCEIRTNTLLKANFFPEKSYSLHVKGKGFMRYQVRMIMGALFQIGKGEISLEFLKESLKAGNDVKLTYVAPGSGLLLNELVFE